MAMTAPSGRPWNAAQEPERSGGSIETPSSTT